MSQKPLDIRRVHRRDLVSLLAPSLGQENSDKVIRSAADQLGYVSDYYEGNEALALFEKLALADGLVGIVARLAKARLRLMIRFEN